MFSTNLFVDANAAKSSILELRCENHLVNYIKFGETAYKERYKHNRVVNDCIKLFHDPQSNLFFDTSLINNEVKKDILSKLLSVKSVGENFHLAKYQICNNENESKQRILFNSNSENSLIILPKSISSGQCAVFWTELRYTNIESIKITWDNNDVKNLKIRKIF